MFQPSATAPGLSNTMGAAGLRQHGPFLTDPLELGGEYRQKRDNLRAFHDDGAHDVFTAWFVIKDFSLTGAYVDVGNIATHPAQRGLYLALPAGL